MSGELFASEVNGKIQDSEVPHSEEPPSLEVFKNDGDVALMDMLSGDEFDLVIVVVPPAFMIL